MKLSRVLPLLLIAAAAAAQQGYFETFEVRLHNLDVVVTDEQGQPVRGLTKEDFIVLEDNAPQVITNFSAYENGAVTADSASAETVRDQAPPRRFVFFVDEMGIQYAARKTLIRHATGLVDQMREGDLGAVIRPTGKHRIAQNFTTDAAAVRRTLAEVIDSCTLRGNRPGMELRELERAFENASGDGDRAYARSRYLANVTDRVRQRLSQLRALVASMAGVEGRKVIVIITSGLSAHPGREFMDLGSATKIGFDQPVMEWGQPGNDFNPIINELARTAAAHGITFYALEPEVPLVARKTAASRNESTTENNRHASVRENLPNSFVDEHLHFRGMTLTSLTKKTGGTWLRGVATIDDVFRQVATDLQSYYSLAYRAKGARDQPRRVTVSIRNRPELRVRTRTEVVDRSPEREMSDLTAANLLFPRERNELPITVTTAGRAKAGRNFFTVPIDVAIPLQALTFLPSEGGKYAAVVDIHFAAAGRHNDYTTSGRHRQTIEISAAQHEIRATTTYRFKTGIDVPRGESRIAIGVMEPVSRLAGFGNLDVDPR